MQFELKLTDDIQKDYIKLIYEHIGDQFVNEVNYDEKHFPFIALLANVYAEVDSDVIEYGVTAALEQYIKSIEKYSDLFEKSKADMYNIADELDDLIPYLESHDSNPSYLLEVIIIKDGKKYSLSYDNNPEEIIEACLELVKK